MKYGKLFYYGTSAFIFAMWWALFATMTNWWGGLLIATGLTGLQFITHRILNNTVEISDD